MTGARSSSDGQAAVSSRDKRRLLTEILKGVSRSFYLTLRILPHGMREPVGVAYLLARAADTIADTSLISPEDRLKHLLEFRARVAGQCDAEAVGNIGDSLDELQTVGREAELLRSLPALFGMLEHLPAEDQDAVRSVVATLTRGMEIDLRTFPPEASGELAALGSAEVLDDYIYHVAGCVGEFWTAISMAHTPALRRWDKDEMSGMGVRFGKALQMTNVLRDVPKDLRIGRCYLTSDALAKQGLTPRDLLDPGRSTEARPVLADGIRLTLEHYAAAEQYILAIPRRNLRLRLAALWTVIIGLGTLAELAGNEAWLNPDRPSKVGRVWIYRTLVFSLLVGRSNSMLRWWISGLRRRVASAL